MFLRRFTDFVLQSRVQAMATAFVSAFIPLIGIVSILITALVTLRKGAIEGLFVLIAATLPYVISYYAAPAMPNQALITTGAIIGIAILSNVLTWVFAVTLRQFDSWSFVLELSLLLGLILVSAVHVLNPEIQLWWAKQLTAYFAKTAAMMSQLDTSLESHYVVPSDLQQHFIATFKLCATGFVVMTILFNALTQVLVGRWWQAALFNPGGLRQELHSIRLGYIASFVFVLVYILAHFGSALALDVMPVLYTLFFVAGLSLLHYLAGLRRLNWVWLIAIYAGLVGLFPLSIIVVTIIALLDTGMDFRKRFR